MKNHSTSDEERLLRVYVQKLKDLADLRSISVLDEYRNIFNSEFYPIFLKLNKAGAELAYVQFAILLCARKQLIAIEFISQLIIFTTDLENMIKKLFPIR